MIQLHLHAMSCVRDNCYWCMLELTFCTPCAACYAPTTKMMTQSMTGGSCPTGWHYYNGSCFSASTTLASQTEARTQCLEEDADLASISDQAEMDFVESIS